MIDIVVRDGSGAGRALAAGPASSPAATKPAVAKAAKPLLLALNPLKGMGTSSVTAAAPRKLDLFARYANRYDRDSTNFVLSVDKPGGKRYGPTGSLQPIRP
ncbi:hypothetical protein TPA0906_02610 [Streptomyces olivaceus]|nr:hypothetical protein EZV63_31840 [Streptomyces sp. VN1]GHI93475.1 hypothetical protein TPA0905_29460 [Streptomyces olivaceus]GHI98395.1 hypothetical protein TPA0906_02610 [Streptomyces olivaceus]